LADEILSDMPVDLRVVNRDVEEVLVKGEIRHLRRILTKNMEMMAKIQVSNDVEIVAFPRTFAMYRDNLENKPSNITRQFICDYYPDGKYILKEIQPIQAPFIFEQAVEELFETFDEEQFQEWQNKLEPLDTRCAMCEG